MGRNFIISLMMLSFAAGFSQGGVNGQLILSSEQNKDFIIRNTKVILVTKKSRDTAFVDLDLKFNFPNAVAGTGYLYLTSPTLPTFTEYKFRIKRKKPTVVNLQYDKFTHSNLRPDKTPEQREADLQTGLLIARIAVDFLLIFSHR